MVVLAAKCPPQNPEWNSTMSFLDSGSSTHLSIKPSGFLQPKPSFVKQYLVAFHLNALLLWPSVIADFTTPGKSHLYGLPLSLCRLLRPLGPFFVL